MTLAWALVWFVASQVALRSLLQSELQIADAEFGRKLADLRLAVAAQPDRPLVLMLGSSRVATGFRPDSLPRHEAPTTKAPLVFNFAQVGSGPEMAHLSLQRLLDAGIQPDWVFLEFWPPTWGAERGLKEFMDQINVGCLDWKSLKLLGGYVSRPRKLDRQWWNMQLFPLVTQREPLLRHFAPSWVLNPSEPDRRCRNLDRLGWWSPMTSVAPEERGRLVERYRRVYEHRLRRYQVAKTPDRALREIIALCQREQIRATVVVLPEGQVFRDLYPENALRDVKAYLEGIRRDCRVEVVDARDWVGDDGFMDGHHLLPEGAAVFTRRLGQDVVQPLLAEAPTPIRR
ncbi:hypothetical protein [Singulisphaera sp. GP187]|uniref:hypothetical protein n=1 Tax=Singulisphaera sp. GP187 TaxID=1882752 RepID=UPI000941A38B|nr:hypothetical protein [Singulisphaera sp. GP187]